MKPYFHRVNQVNIGWMYLLWVKSLFPCYIISQTIPEKNSIWIFSSCQSIFWHLWYGWLETWGLLLWNVMNNQESSDNSHESPHQSFNNKLRRGNIWIAEYRFVSKQFLLLICFGVIGSFPQDYSLLNYNLQSPLHLNKWATIRQNPLLL